MKVLNMKLGNTECQFKLTIKYDSTEGALSGCIIQVDFLIGSMKTKVCLL